MIKIDLQAIEDAAKELYIRALKVLPPDIKAGFSAASTIERNRRHREEQVHRRP